MKKKHRNTLLFQPDFPNMKEIREFSIDGIKSDVGMIYISNFNILIKLEGNICVGQTRKKSKIDENPTFLGL